MSSAQEDKAIIETLAKRIGFDVNEKIADYDDDDYNKEVRVIYNADGRVIHLNLSKQNLTKMPDEVMQLSGLQELHLSDNQLQEVPRELGKLKNLEYLWLHENQLQEVPETLGDLQSLQVLALDHNNLKKVPAALGELTHLDTLWLHEDSQSQAINNNDNPNLLTPPPEIIARGIEEIFNFLRELQDDSTTRYESKLLIVGEGGTGKSSLLRALHGLDYVKGLNTTHGIEVDELKLSYAGEDLTLDTWDFGGQHIYHSTHQFFLTERSLYVIVWNAHLGVGQGRLDYWLETIKTLAPKAPILLVATHIDERPADLNYQQYKQAYPQLVGHVEISNLDGTGIEKLKEKLAEEAAKLPLMGQQWPGKWIKAEKSLKSRRESYIGVNTYTRICAAHKVDKEIANGSLGKYLHDLGKILYFMDDPWLNNHVVLQPEWVTQAMARVLDDLDILHAGGILQHKDLVHIWTRDDEGRVYERALHPFLFRLMERFEISSQIESDIPGQDNQRSLIPLLLPHEPPIQLPPWPTRPLQDQTQVEMLYRMDFVPAGIMSRFIVRTHRYSTGNHWRDGVLLAYQQHEARVELNTQKREIHLLVQGTLPQNFFTVLMNILDDILKRFEGLVVRREIPCICHWQTQSDQQCGRFYLYQDLVRRLEKKRDTIECPETLTDVSVPTLLYGIHSSTQGQIIEEIKEGTREIRAARQQLTMQDAHQQQASADLKQGQRAIQHRLDDLQKLDVIIQRVDQQTELIRRNFTRQWNLAMARLEAECPNTFILERADQGIFNPKNWVSQHYQLFLVCQHPPKPHPVEQGYDLRQAEEWWVTISPWLSRLVDFLKFAVPLGGKAAEMLLNEADLKRMQSGLTMVEGITDALAKPASLDSMDRRVTVPSLHREQDPTGPALRALYNYLKEIDKSSIWGGLYRTPTPEGHILWLCDHHRQEYISKPLQI